MKNVVNMACGLANRMFQYSYYLYLKEQGYPVEVDFYTSAKLAHESVAWKSIFPNAFIEQASWIDVLRLGGASDLLSRICRHYFPYLTHVKQMPTAFDAQLPDEGKSQYLIGVFQNAKMVETVSDEVFKAFSFADLEGDDNLRLQQELQGQNSVSIHVRKGADYQQRIWYQNTCPTDYYLDAVRYIRKHVENPHFYVFADNKDWVKENFTDLDYTLVDGNPVSGWGSHFDMQLMSLCKYNIISNSTYSWWGAFLNKFNGKIVICPRIWFNPESTEEYESTRLLCENWIAI